jgi:hypothetical protein
MAHAGGALAGVEAGKDCGRMIDVDFQTDAALIDTKQVAAMMGTLMNCRLMAARERQRAKREARPKEQEAWEAILRFCKEAGVKGSVLR